MTTATAATATNGAGTTVNDLAEAEILSAIFYRPELMRDILDGYGGECPPLDSAQFGGRHTYRVAKAVWKLHAEGSPISRSTVTAGMADTDKAAQIVQRLEDRATEATIGTLPLNIHEVVALALHRTLVKETEATLEQARAKPREAVSLAQALQRRLSDISQRRATKRDNSIAAVVASGEMDAAVLGRPIGLGFWDDVGDPRVGREGMMGGLGPGEKLIFASNPGGRKTSTCVYVVNQMAMPRRQRDVTTGEVTILPGERVLYVMLDDNRAVFTQWSISQMATAKLIRDGADPRHYGIKSRGLPTAFRTPEQHAAILWATNLVSRLPIFIIDGADDAHNFATTLESIRHYVVNEGVTTVVIDYLQALRVKGVKAGDIYARMDAVCSELYPLFTDLGPKYGAKLIATSQQSEGVNAHGVTGEQGGLAGGGPLFQFANYILRTSAPGNEPGTLYIRGHKMRTAQKGLSVKYQVVPSNGYITNPDAMPMLADTDAP